jgi:phosphoribosylanthranilate isomerase
MSVAIKICGVRTFPDALLAAQAGADMLGVNFYQPSPRYINPADARALCDSLRADLGADCPLLIGVFVNETPERITAIAETVGLDYAQLSGDEPPETIAALKGMALKALRPRDVEEAIMQVGQALPCAPDDERAPSVLLDAYHPKLYGGTGEQTSLEIALAVKERVPRLMLAGGLNPDNVAGRVEAIRPWGVDVAGGVEVPGQPGQKDHARIRLFVEAVRSVGGARR